MSKPLCFTDPVKLRADIGEYFEHCQATQTTMHLRSGEVKVRQTFPSVAGLCVWLGISRDTFYSYIDRESKPIEEDVYIEISDTLSRAREKIVADLVQSALVGDAEARIAAMLLTAMGEGQKVSDLGTVTVKIQGSGADEYSV